MEIQSSYLGGLLDPFVYPWGAMTLVKPTSPKKPFSGFGNQPKPKGPIQVAPLGPGPLTMTADQFAKADAPQSELLAPMPTPEKKSNLMPLTIAAIVALKFLF